MKITRRQFTATSTAGAAWLASNPDIVEAADRHAGIRAGAAQRDITPPIGYEIQHYYRKSIGVHDPLFTRCLYLEDETGNSVAVICTDLIRAKFDACDQLREEIREETGVKNSLISCSHSHSSAQLGPRGRPASASDKGSKWNDSVHDAILAIVKEAKRRAEPVSLRAGRSAAQVGFNRRLIDEKDGHVFMGVNRDGPVVPWVNVLVAESKKTERPIAVLFEHAAHPVIVPDKSQLISADYPGAAVKRVREELGEDVIALFGQGCCGNINGYPLRSTHENAEQAGWKLGDAVLNAMKEAVAIKADKLDVRSAQSMLPSHPLPSEELWQRMAAESKNHQLCSRDGPNDRCRVDQLNKIRNLMVRGAEPPPRRFDASAVMVGREWCLVTMPHEMFCQYELWIDKNTPVKYTMAFAYTNGYERYIAVDEAWRLGPKAGYEAASLPNWGGQVWTEHFGPPAVGSEKIVKDTIASLWPKAD